MSRRNNRVVTYLSDEEEAQLDEWADESGKSRSALLREAILEYLDHDRAARAEDLARENQALLEELHAHLLNDDTHTHKDQGGMKRGSDSLEKARQMVRRLQANHNEVIKADDVDRVIEDMAGVDDRTLRKYKDIFRRRGLLFEHPGQTAVWTTDGNQWLSWLENFAALNGPKAAEEIADQYPTTVVGGETLDVTLTEEADL
jgi:predicted DNA-binding protein